MTTIQKEAAMLLDNAASYLIENGWTNDPYNYSDDSACIWQAVLRADPEAERSVFDFAERAIIKFANVPDLDALFVLNDSKSENEGLEWATGVLYDARDSLDPDFLVNNKIQVEQNWFTSWVSKTKEKVYRWWTAG